MKTTEKILMELVQHRGEQVSGTQLANHLALSRTSVWKAIKSLQEAGQFITSDANGYQYQLNNQLNATVIAALASDLGWQILTFDSIDSTNLEAKRQLAAGLTVPTVLIANTQTNGYGRFSREFYSPKTTGLYLTWVIPQIEGQINPGKLTTGTAVAIGRVIERNFGVNVGVKWVNDLIVADRKVTGILSEAVSDFESHQLTSVLVGVGLNINQSPTVPEAIRQKAGYLNQHHREINRNQLCVDLIQQFSQMWTNQTDPSLMQWYRDHSLVIGQAVTLKSGSQVIEGTVTGITDDGELELATGVGTKVFGSGEITKVTISKGAYHG